MAKNNSNLRNPKSLTRCGIWSLHRANLIHWATQNCLLEHLSNDEVAKLNKEGLVEECLGAILRLEVSEDQRAAMTDQTARPVEDLLVEV